MAVVAAELIAYASAGQPVTDGTSSGGAIDPKTRVIFTDLAAPDTLYVKSTSASDTGNIVIVTRDAAGSDNTQTVAINGTTGTNLTGTHAHMMSATMAADAVGTVTVGRGTITVPGTAVSTITPGERGFIRLFRFATVPASATTDRYEKFFFKNTNGSLALQDVVVSESGDSTTYCTYAMEDAVNDNTSVANRITAPGGSDIGGSGFVNTPTTLTMGTETDALTKDLAPGAAIGIWVKFSLPAGYGGTVGGTWTGQIAGTTAP
jgi:hypothetical protein